jgi:molybdenum cofactor biosynthesis enzyme MoaA
MAEGGAYTLRLVVNGKCNFKCSFCFQEGTAYAQKSLLSAQDFVDLVTAFAEVRSLLKVRITGGEPLLYESLGDMVECLHSGLPEVDLGLTTNGSLPQRLESLVKRVPALHVNISLPSLRSDRFRELTGSRHFDCVTRSIALATRYLLSPPSLNFVFVPERNRDDLVPMIQFAQSAGCRLKLICLTENEFNRERLLTDGISRGDTRVLERELDRLGYEEQKKFEYRRGDHRIAIVDCGDQRAISYFERHRSLRIYYDGHAAVTGDNDGFARSLGTEDAPRELISLAHEVETALRIFDGD